MPTYAILGGTGNTGSHLIERLVDFHDVMMHIYVRSRAKLIKAYPSLAGPGSPHRTFEGDLSNVDVFADCLADADAVFSFVGTNANNPEVRLAQDSAAAIIGALSKLKTVNTSQEFKCPTVIFLSSAGVTSDPRVRANFPGYLHWMLQQIIKYIYIDFRRATALLNKPENAWIPVIFFCVPCLTDGPSQGNVKVGANIPKNAPVYVTYTDLAIGMIQAVEEQKDLIHKEIGIAGAKMPPLTNYGTMMFYFATGLMCVWAPPLWRFGYRNGWWGIS